MKVKCNASRGFSKCDKLDKKDIDLNECGEFTEEFDTICEGKSTRTLQKKGKTSLLRFRMKPSYQYSITDHGHFASRIYADSDQDALRQYRQWYKQKYGKGKAKDESLDLDEALKVAFSLKDYIEKFADPKAKEVYDRLLEISDEARLDAALESMFPDGCNLSDLDAKFIAEDNEHNIEKLLVSGVQTGESLREEKKVKNVEKEIPADVVKMVAELQEKLDKAFKEAEIDCFRPKIDITNEEIFIDVLPNKARKGFAGCNNMNVGEILALDEEEGIDEEDTALCEAIDFIDDQCDKAEKIINKVADEFEFKKAPVEKKPEDKKR